jgi:hypothetical protein
MAKGVRPRTGAKPAIVKPVTTQKAAQQKSAPKQPTRGVTNLGKSVNKPTQQSRSQRIQGSAARVAIADRQQKAKDKAKAPTKATGATKNPTKVTGATKNPTKVTGATKAQEKVKNSLSSKPTGSSPLGRARTGLLKATNTSKIYSKVALTDSMIGLASIANIVMPGASTSLPSREDILRDFAASQQHERHMQQINDGRQAGKAYAKSKIRRIKQ